MLQIKFRIILLLCLIAVLLIIMRQIRNKRLDLRYTLSWLLLIGVLFILVLFPQMLNLLTKFVGIYLPTNMLFLMGFVFSLVIIFSLTSAVSRQAEEIKKLAQRLALLEKRDKSEQTESDSVTKNDFTTEE